MAKQVSIKVAPRLALGRINAKKTRAASLVPGIVYGSHIQPFPIQADAKEIDRIFKHSRSENMLVDLTVEDGGKSTNRLAFIQEIQHHPLTDKVLHLDFHEIRADEKLHVPVELVAAGEPEGVRTSGGILDQPLRRLEIECLPKDLPERIEVDVSALQIGDSIHVKDIKVPVGVTVISPAELSVFSVSAPVKEEVAAAPVAGAAEPELIKKKTEDGEEPKADAKAGAKPADAKGGDAKAGAKPAGKK